MSRGIAVAYHVPVLLQASIEGLAVKESGVYVDATFGGGGHSREILKSLGRGGRLWAFDQDQDVKSNEIDDSRFMLIRENFGYMKRFLRYHDVEKVDGILIDLGISSHQIDVPERGFSFRLDGPLDMRMDKNNEMSAYRVLNEYSESELSDVLYRYGELKQARKMAKVIVLSRERKAIKSTWQFNDILSQFLNYKTKNRVLAQVYQALRIEVNKEIEMLKQALEQSLEMLNPGGRLSVISYHSLEDRLVKRFFRSGNFEGKVAHDFYGNKQTPFKSVVKLLVPADVELRDNNRARSAKLRVVEKI